MNKCILQGRLTANAELKTTQSGLSVCSFTIAVNRKFKDKSGNYQADFINCVAWRNTAEFISKYFSKGKMILVCGSLQTRQYDDKNGNKRTVTEVIVDEADFCGKDESKTNEFPAVEQNQPLDIAGFTPLDDGSNDELPF